MTFDTSSIAGTVGSVDFQWNLGVLDPSLTAIVSDFGGASFTDPATLLFGNVSGSLAPGGRLLFAATDPNNYIYQALTFGTSLSFRVALPDSAPAPTPGAFPSEFAISLFDSLLSAALPSTSPAGAALAFELAPGRRPVPDAVHRRLGAGRPRARDHRTDPDGPGVAAALVEARDPPLIPRDTGAYRAAGQSARSVSTAVQSK